MIQVLAEKRNNIITQGQRVQEDANERNKSVSGIIDTLQNKRGIDKVQFVEHKY